MPSYWIVVRRNNRDLFDTLSVAFRGRTGFSVVADRRVAAGERHPNGPERREAQAVWGADEFMVAERLEPDCLMV
jgi:hypothetical protein